MQQGEREGDTLPKNELVPFPLPKVSCMLSSPSLSPKMRCLSPSLFPFPRKELEQTPAAGALLRRERKKGELDRRLDNYKNEGSRGLKSVGN